MNIDLNILIKTACACVFIYCLGMTIESVITAYVDAVSVAGARL